MPNVLASIAGFLGGPIGIVPGAILGVDTGFIGNLIGLGQKHEKPEQASTAIKTARPPRVSAYGTSRLYFAYLLYETASNGTAIDIGAFHHGQHSGVVQWYLNDDAVTVVSGFVQGLPDKRYGENKVSLHDTDGSNPGTVLTTAVALLPGIWTSDHRGDDIVTAALFCAPVKADKFLEIYPNGVPTMSLAAQWQKCPDFNAIDPTDEGSWTWTENPIRHLGHYKMVREGVDYATKIAPTLEYWQAAQDVCDEAVALKAGGTEARYRSCIAHKHTDPAKAVTGALLGTCDGWIAPRSDGALIVYAGQYTAPTVSIGPEHIIAYEWDGVGVDDDSAINEIVLSYVSAAHGYTSPEATPWTDEDDISERGQVLSTTLDMQVPSHAQMRRLAKRHIARTNAPNRGTVTTNAAGRAVRGHRYINLTIEEAGTTFFDGVAEITGLTRNLATGGVTFSWVRADPNVDAWNPATEEGEPATLGDRVAQAPLDAPVIVSAVFFGSDHVGSGTPGARARITATGPDRDDLIWFARWRAVGATIWNEQQYTDIDPGPSVILETGFVPVDSAVEVSVAYQVGDGRVSPWSTPSVEVLTGSITFDSTEVSFDSTVITWDRT